MITLLNSFSNRGDGEELKTYFKLPLIVALFAIGLLLSFLSLTTRTELVEETILSYEVPPMTDMIEELHITGELVRASSDVPEGIRIYFLTEDDYRHYNETGVLPDTLIDHEKNRVEVGMPSFILIKNELNEPITVNLHIEVYEIDMPYAILSIPSYVLTLVAVVLLMERLMAWVREQKPKNAESTRYFRSQLTPLSISQGCTFYPA